jgi:alpha-tubulin suppressor-like RCC1 family protein
MDGELGNNSTTASNAPVEVVGVGGVGFLSGITQVSSNDGTVYCWGDNISGTLGNNTYTNSQTPVEVLGVGGTGFLSNIVQILNSDDTACGLSSSGNVFCWGDDYADQLGDNEANEYSATPIEVPGVGETGFLSGIASLAQGQGDGTLCALSLAGNVYCWGYNTAGELGDNSTSSVMGPVEVVGVGGVGFLSGIASLGASADTVCAVSSAGNQYCWGLNTYGELGNNSTTNSSVPVEVVGVGGTGILSSVVSASSGRYIGCAIVTSGNIYCWGDNSFGELGINSTTNSLTPVEVMGVGGTGVLSLY